MSDCAMTYAEQCAHYTAAQARIRTERFGATSCTVAGKIEAGRAAFREYMTNYRARVYGLVSAEQGVK